jgi:hypothetical protein
MEAGSRSARAALPGAPYSPPPRLAATMGGAGQLQRLRAAQMLAGRPSSAAGAAGPLSRTLPAGMGAGAAAGSGGSGGPRQQQQEPRRRKSSDEVFAAADAQAYAGWAAQAEGEVLVEVQAAGPGGGKGEPSGLPKAGQALASPRRAPMVSTPPAAATCCGHLLRPPAGMASIPSPRLDRPACPAASSQAAGGHLGGMLAARQALLAGAAPALAPDDEGCCWGPEGLVRRVESDSSALLARGPASRRRLGRLAAG